MKVIYIMKVMYMICENYYYNLTLDIILLLFKLTKIIIKPETPASGNLSLTDPMSCILFLVVDMKKIIFIFRVFPYMRARSNYCHRQE